ncbi:MAG: alpha/beta hydrolase [Proteobacteria bacterium]|nr:alpha/beta hydrolase [Candidatus Fonsibacter sp. PEL4]
MKLRRIFLYFFLSSIILYASVCVYMYVFQRNFLYHPDKNNYLRSEKLNADTKEISVPSTEGIALKAWFYKNPQNKYTVLFFHGNAGGLGNRIYKLNELKNLNLNYLIISWRGFSGNKGSPTEQGLYSDARSALKWLEKNNISKSKIILYGESLGTGVAVEVGQNQKFAGIILESPYTSIVDAAKIYYPYLPVDLILKDKYLSLKKIKNINSPTLIMHGGADIIIPIAMGKKLFDEVQSKKYGYFPQFDRHMMTYNSELKLELQKFIKTLN